MGDFTLFHLPIGMITQTMGEVRGLYPHLTVWIDHTFPCIDYRSDWGELLPTGTTVNHCWIGALSYLI